MKKLILLRHGESTWNNENRFTGWTDVDLTEKGVEEARKAGQLLKKEGYHFDKVYTSYLTRAIKTMNMVLEQMDQLYIPVEKSWRLNEKHYGNLQGLNKAETAQKYGDEQVNIWRRSYSVAPDPLAINDARAPHGDPRYRGVDPSLLPLTESLKDTVCRIVPYLENTILPTFKNCDQILVAAHGNSLRGIIKHIKKIDDDKIVSLNLPTAIPYLMLFDDDMNLVKDEFLGDPETIKALMDAVANQAKKK